LNSKKKEETRELIKKIVLLNALRYGGKAQPKPVLGKLLGEHPKFRQKIKEVNIIIKEVVQEINKLSLKKQKEIVVENWPEALTEEKTEEEKN
jgi:glutamyl-tRNA synthetase